MSFRLDLLEKLIDTDEWLTSGCPDELLDKALEVSDSGIQTAIGYDKELGWFFICYNPVSEVNLPEEAKEKLL